MMMNPAQKTMDKGGRREPDDLDLVESSRPCTDCFIMEQNSSNADAVEPTISSLMKGTKRKTYIQEQAPSLSSLSPSSLVDVEITGVTSIEKSTGRWTAQEHEAFINGLSMYGREWKRVVQLIPTRTSAQVRSHAQKYFHHLEQHHQRQLVTSHDARIRSTESNQSDSDTFDFNTDTIDDHHQKVNETMDGMNPTASHPSMLDIASMSDSVREQAIRIYNDPSSVHNEVNATLVQLRQRYQELQNRYAALQHYHQSNTNRRHTFPSTATNKHYVDIDNRHTTTTNTNSSSSSTQIKLDEQIVVEVLQARLQQYRDTNHSNSNDRSTASYDGDVETDDNDDME